MFTLYTDDIHADQLNGIGTFLSYIFQHGDIFISYSFGGIKYNFIFCSLDHVIKMMWHKWQARSAVRALEEISHPASQQSLQVNKDKCKFLVALEMYQEIICNKGSHWFFFLITQWWICHLSDEARDQQDAYLASYGSVFLAPMKSLKYTY